MTEDDRAEMYRQLAATGRCLLVIPQEAERDEDAPQEDKSKLRP